jgi:hypothetical protein
MSHREHQFRFEPYHATRDSPTPRSARPDACPRDGGALVSIACRSDIWPLGANQWLSVALS